MKSRRQSAILELVDVEAITSQEQLRERLRLRGIEATQATLSRDIRDLGLIKRAADGAYRRSGADGRLALGVPRDARRRARQPGQPGHPPGDDDGAGARRGRRLLRRPPRLRG